MITLPAIPAAVKVAPEPESFSAQLLAAVAKGDGCWSEPTEADRRWAAATLNGPDRHDQGATSPDEASRWDPTTPDDVMEAEGEYLELARLAEEAEAAARVEAGCYAW